jgi:penicillin-binding protein 1A
VFGGFPTQTDPRSAVIWEAFQPETEPRRSFRRNRPNDEELLEQARLAAQRRAQQRSLPGGYQRPAPVSPFQPPQPAPLQNTTAAP